MPQPIQPDDSGNQCAVCGARAPFIQRNRQTREIDARWCATHVPDEWGMAKSLTRMLEEAFLAETNQARERTLGEPANSQV